MRTNEEEIIYEQRVKLKMRPILFTWTEIRKMNFCKLTTQRHNANEMAMWHKAKHHKGRNEYYVREIVVGKWKADLILMQQSVKWEKK